jgi:hypothetical protein
VIAETEFDVFIVHLALGPTRLAAQTPPQYRLISLMLTDLGAVAPKTRGSGLSCRRGGTRVAQATFFTPSVVSEKKL